jgi:pimeloyl-ACP methyl ester carboxylesterase
MVPEENPILSQQGDRHRAKEELGMATTAPRTGYASVNGLKLYYEDHGSGRPLVLLHGNLSTILAGTPFEQDYARTAPNPEAWPTLVAKVKQMNREQPEWPAEAIRSIKAPTLLIIGDSDIVRPEGAVEMFRLLGGGVVGDVAGLPRSQLAVLPGTTHITLVQRADWLVSMVGEFLDAPMPEAG